jgi:hypothetical protein
MTRTEAIITALFIAPIALVLIIALLRGYDVHIDMHRKDANGKRQWWFGSKNKDQDNTNDQAKPEEDDHP